MFGLTANLHYFLTWHLHTKCNGNVDAWVFNRSVLHNSVDVKRPFLDEHNLSTIDKGVESICSFCFEVNIKDLVNVQVLVKLLLSSSKMWFLTSKGKTWIDVFRPDGVCGLSLVKTSPTAKYKIWILLSVQIVRFA